MLQMIRNTPKRRIKENYDKKIVYGINIQREWNWFGIWIGPAVKFEISYYTTTTTIGGSELERFVAS